MNIFNATLITAIQYAVAFVAVGILIGFVHFSVLRWNAQLFVNDEAMWRPIILQLVRMAFTSAGFLVCAFAGTVPLLAALTGLLLARQFTIRKARVA